MQLSEILPLVAILGIRFTEADGVNGRRNSMQDAFDERIGP